MVHLFCQVSFPHFPILTAFRMAVRSDLACTLNHLHLPAFPTLSFLGRTNSFISVPQLLHLPLPAHPPPPCSCPQVFSYGFAFFASLPSGPKLLYPPSYSLSFQSPLIFLVIFFSISFQGRVGLGSDFLLFVLCHKFIFGFLNIPLLLSIVFVSEFVCEPLVN